MEINSFCHVSMCWNPLPLE